MLRSTYASGRVRSVDYSSNQSSLTIPGTRAVYPYICILSAPLWARQIFIEWLVSSADRMVTPKFRAAAHDVHQRAYPPDLYRGERNFEQRHTTNVKRRIRQVSIKASEGEGSSTPTHSNHAHWQIGWSSRTFEQLHTTYAKGRVPARSLSRRERQKDPPLLRTATTHTGR